MKESTPGEEGLILGWGFGMGIKTDARAAGSALALLKGLHGDRYLRQAGSTAAQYRVSRATIVGIRDRAA